MDPAPLGECLASGSVGQEIQKMRVRRQRECVEGETVCCSCEFWEKKNEKLCGFRERKTKMDVAQTEHYLLHWRFLSCISAIFTALAVHIKVYYGRLSLKRKTKVISLKHHDLLDVCGSAFLSSHPALWRGFHVFVFLCRAQDVSGLWPLGVQSAKNSTKSISMESCKNVVMSLQCCVHLSARLAVCVMDV